MTTADRLQAVVDGIENVRLAVEDKGATLPTGSPLGDYPAAVEAIDTAWVDTPPSDVTDTSYMFFGWPWIETVSLFDTSNVTNTYGMFNGCTSLITVPLFDTSNVTAMSAMFTGCSSLAEVEFTDCSKVTAASNMFGTTSATPLERLILPGMRVGFNLANTQMSAPALDDFFHSLGTASGSQTIDITGTPGAGDCDRTIATNKGWTITG